MTTQGAATESTPLLKDAGAARLRVRDAWNIHELNIALLLKEFDADKSGELDRDEFKCLLTAFNKGVAPSDEEVDLIMKLADVNHDGTISQKELSRGMSIWWTSSHMEEIWPEGFALFEKYDADKNGKLDQSELKMLLKELNGGLDVPDVEVAQVMDTADASGDERIGRYEVQMLNIAICEWVMRTRRSPTPQTEIAKAAMERASVGWFKDMQHIGNPVMAVSSRLMELDRAAMARPVKVKRSSDGQDQDLEGQGVADAIAGGVILSGLGALGLCALALTALMLVPAILAVCFGHTGLAPEYLPCGSLFPGALAKLTLAQGICGLVSFGLCVCVCVPCSAPLQSLVTLASVVISILLLIEAFNDHANPAKCYPTLLTFAWVWYFIMPIVFLSIAVVVCCCGCCCFFTMLVAAEGTVGN